MTKIIRKTTITREKLRGIIMKNPEVFLPGLDLVDIQLGNEEDGIIEFLGTDKDGRLSLVDFENCGSDALLLRALSQAQWLKKNERLVKRLFFNENIDFAKSLRIILVAPSFSTQVKAAVKQIGLHEIIGIAFNYLVQGQEDAIMFEEVFCNRTPLREHRANGSSYAQEKGLPREMPGPTVVREPAPNGFPGETDLTAEEIAEFMDFDNKPA